MNDKIREMMSDPHVKDVMSKADLLIQAGHDVYFKWTCGVCGERVMSEKPNILNTSYLHEDCGFETKTVEGDLGFLLVMKAGHGTN